MLVISSIHELEERGALSIGGQVARPGSYPFAANTTLEDLIFQAGGLLEGASTARVDISRRIVDPTSTQQTQQISEIYTVSIENGLALNSGKGFKLMPYDHVEVRKSPGYNAQESVSVRGEVLFDGSYVLQKRNERLTDIIKRAGGILDEAYIKGAYLTRRLSEDELASRREVLRLAMANSGPGMGDSIALSKINVSPTYNVGINLEKAIQNPGSHYDVVLQPGDALFIPEQQSTVKIAGDVMFPNTVVYEPGKNSATTSTRPAATDSAPARTKRLSYISTVLWLKQNAAPLSNPDVRLSCPRSPTPQIPTGQRFSHSLPHSLL